MPGTTKHRTPTFKPPKKNWQHFAGAWARTTPASWGFNSPPPHTQPVALRREAALDPQAGRVREPQLVELLGPTGQEVRPRGTSDTQRAPQSRLPSPPRKSFLAWKRKKSGMEDFPRFRLCVIPYGPFLSWEYMTSAPIFSGEKMCLFLLPCVSSTYGCFFAVVYCVVWRSVWLGVLSFVLCGDSNGGVFCWIVGWCQTVRCIVFWIALHCPPPLQPPPQPPLTMARLRIQSAAVRHLPHRRHRVSPQPRLPATALPTELPGHRGGDGQSR